MSTIEQAPTEGLLKRKQEDEAAPTSSEPEAKLQKLEGEVQAGLRQLKRGPISKAREIRLEQNRKAARESRRRKKVMIEELQRSVIFFSRANGTLKHQNDDLSRMLMTAQSQVAAIETQQQPSTNAPASSPAPQAKSEAVQPQGSFQQAEANAVATQAVYESQGFSAAAARAAAQTMNGSNSGSSAPQGSTQPSSPTPAATPSSQNLPPMQPGATMQAMANFQQAAAAAMQAAVQGMQGIPGVSVQALTATAPGGANPQQAYNDTMTALAMQQAAAAAAAGQQFFHQNPFMTQPFLTWQTQPQGPAPQQAPAPPQAPTQP